MAYMPPRGPGTGSAGRDGGGGRVEEDHAGGGTVNSTAKSENSVPYACGGNDSGGSRRSPGSWLARGDQLVMMGASVSGEGRATGGAGGRVVAAVMNVGTAASLHA